jgi:hypothetical protein
MIKYVICVIISFSFLIQTTTAATDPDYNFDFAAGIHANTTENSQNICSGKDYGCIIGFFGGGDTCLYLLVICSIL